ncbi:MULTISPECIES: hypothetical protein [Amycolatopsis]|uniref:Uncharacterized protein n=1 Tax=Amycolatopsis albidoflavus TaxID=102226 RepID=A0ABW5HXJ5_9PSEU
MITLAVATNSRTVIDVTNGSDTDIEGEAVRKLAANWIHFFRKTDLAIWEVALRILGFLLTLGAAAILVTACDNSVNGKAAPSTPASQSASAGNPFAARNQCALLDQILGGAGYPPAKPSIAQERKACVTQNPAAA